MGGSSLQALDTGYAALNAVLPGDGWPQGALVEVLQAQAGQHEWGLVAPALAGLQAAAPGQLLVLTGAPGQPFGPALGARQIDMFRLLCVQSTRGDAPALLWATREALQCADVVAVLAWLPDVRSAHLRRLQIAAHAHNKLLFVFRTPRAQLESSPASLRLLLEGVNQEGGNLRVHVFKRHGPPLSAPLLLDTRPARLTALLTASRERARLKREEAVPLFYRQMSMRCWTALHTSITTEPGAGLLDEADAQRAVASMALGFTPRVALLDEAVLMDVTGSLRLFGGLARLMQQLECRLLDFFSVKSAR
ncbi:MAG: translesion DNA synthesis-associated protein ImuA [Polaromonas sp.]|uniref:translesion DNA synthesis-associated protein ImuA n=1 Tax=Polaromonas sp. TaxID=1869339 RepID=UPI0027323E15|nr:translesion DNA synthesis-associated protein ImuA [Polaromonas sp.]MDP2819900.1 translesion DNA synthesis-associated protein ImuA [Polaromonas sp.]